MMSNAAYPTTLVERIEGPRARRRPARQHAPSAKMLAVAKTLNLVGTLVKPGHLKALQALVKQFVPVTDA
jgi:hypothetical protein